MTVPVVVEAAFGGRSLSFKWSWKAVTALCKRWDLKGEKELEKRMASIDPFDDIPTILWAMARSHHPEISEPEMLDLIDDTSLDECGALVQSVIAAAQPPKRTAPQ